ncbi:MAG: hypothetical protein DCO99_12640, partial [Synechococcus sp. XM-24]
MVSQLNPFEDQNLNGDQGLEGGDLSRKSPLADGDVGVGGGEDVTRSLERVAAQEALLSADSLGTGLEDQLLSEQPSELPLRAQNDDPIDSTTERRLLVVDTTNSNWEELVSNAGDTTDILFLDGNSSSDEQIVEAIKKGGYGASEVTIAGSENEGVTTDSENTTDDSHASSGINEEVVATPLEIRHATEDQGGKTSGLEATRVDDASELLIQARLTLRTAEATGSIQEAVKKSFNEETVQTVEKNLREFLDGKARPDISWTTFDDERILGAYLTKSSEILISESLKQNIAVAEATTLEEIGHWLERSSGLDSAGDEGEKFAANITGTEIDAASASDRVFITVNGNPEEAELAWQGTISNTPVVGITADPVGEDKVILTLEQGVSNGGTSTYFKFQTPTDQFSTSVNHVLSATAEENKLVLTVNKNANIDWDDPSLQLVYEPTSGAYGIKDGAGNAYTGFSFTFPAGSLNPGTLNPTGTSYQGSEFWIEFGPVDLKRDTATWESLKSALTVYAGPVDTLTPTQPVANAINAIIDVTAGILKLDLNDQALAEAGVTNGQQLKIVFDGTGDILETIAGTDVQAFEQTFRADLTGFAGIEDTTIGDSAIQHYRSSESIIIRPETGKFDPQNSSNSLKDAFELYSLSGFSTILREPQSVEVHEDYIELKIDRLNFAFNGQYKLTYTPGASQIKGSNGNPIGGFEQTFGFQTGAGDTTPPGWTGPIFDKFSSSISWTTTDQLDPSGNNPGIEELFSLSLDANGSNVIANAIKNAFVTGDGVKVELDSVALEAAGIQSSQELFINYTDPNGVDDLFGVIQNSDGTDASSFTFSFVFSTPRDN